MVRNVRKGRGQEIQQIRMLVGSPATEGLDMNAAVETEDAPAGRGRSELTAACPGGAKASFEILESADARGRLWG